ncbi:hypothetical protein GIB67_009619 [Kingdonia uniflora]|uniref:MBD domain-containing protein n=1 Tax=Kingdonia uniflora TaxID=39325 RepID=A0A7J7M2F1_9MAGN|nr:hypothetical protein GIB67_009619 [Kingdonia uniflora]
MGRPRKNMLRANNKQIIIYSSDKNMAESPDQLPEGWTVELKTRKSGALCGHQYKCYIAPLTGYKFYSKRDVSRYLNTTQYGAQKSKQQKLEVTMHSKRSVNKQSKSKVVVQRKDTVDGLPPGWTAEIRVRTGGKRDKPRKDAYYTDPATGSTFPSKKAVLRYLGIEEFDKNVSKQNKEGMNGGETSLPPVTRNGKRKRSETEKHFVTGEISNLNVVNDEKNPESPVTESLVTEEMPLLRHTEDHCKALELHCRDCPDPSAQADMQHSPKESVSAKPGALVPFEICPLENGVVKPRKMKTKICLSKRQNKKNLDLPCRASKRIAKLHAKPVPDLETSSSTPMVAAQKPLPEANLDRAATIPVFISPPNSDPNLFSLENIVFVTEEQLKEMEKLPGNNQTPHREFETEERPLVDDKITLENAVEKPPSLEKKVTFEKLKIEKIQSAGDQVTPKKRGTEENKLGDPANPEKCGNEENKLADPATPEKCGIEGKTDSGKEPESSFIFPFGDSWPDPCLEFAFKTLTGAIPVEDYFEQLKPTPTQAQSTSDLRVPDFARTDGLCQTNSIFQFDSMKPSFAPELQGKVSVSAPGDASGKGAR